MPLYEYQCRPNQHRFEVRHGYTEEPVKVCPECGGEVRRVIHPVGVVFKGSGFYVNDSRKSTRSTKPAESAPGEKSAATTESKGGSSDTKSGSTEPKSGAPDTKSGASNTPAPSSS